MISGLDHLAIAVNDLNSAVALWQTATGAEVVHREIVHEQKVEVVMLKIGELKIELLCPTDQNSGVGKFLATRGPGLHHLALKADSTQQELDRLTAAGVRLIDTCARNGAEETRVGFLHPKALEGVLVEIVEHDHERSR